MDILNKHEREANRLKLTFVKIQSGNGNFLDKGKLGPKCPAV